MAQLFCILMDFRLNTAPNWHEIFCIGNIWPEVFWPPKFLFLFYFYFLAGNVLDWPIFLPENILCWNILARQLKKHICKIDSSTFLWSTLVHISDKLPTGFMEFTSHARKQKWWQIRMCRKWDNRFYEKLRYHCNTIVGQ